MFGLCATDAALDSIDAVVEARNNEDRKKALLVPMRHLLSVSPESASWRDVYEAVGSLAMIADQILGEHHYTHDHSDPIFFDPDTQQQLPGFEIGMLDLDAETLDLARSAVDRAVEAQDWPCVMSGWSHRETQQSEIDQMHTLRNRIRDGAA